MARKIKPVIGRNERIDFPTLHLKGIRAKIDTGAFTSAIHAHQMHIVQENGKPILRCKLLDPSHPRYRNRWIRFKQFSMTVVKNSSGQREERFKVKAKIGLGGNEFITAFTLTNRNDMRYPVLLGRKALTKFWVDVGKVYVLKK